MSATAADFRLVPNRKGAMNLANINIVEPLRLDRS